MKEVPPLWPALISTIYSNSLVVLLYMILTNYSPPLSAATTCAAMVVISMFRKEYRMGWKHILDTLESVLFQ